MDFKREGKNSPLNLGKQKLPLLFSSLISHLIKVAVEIVYYYLDLNINSWIIVIRLPW